MATLDDIKRRLLFYNKLAYLTVDTEGVYPSLANISAMDYVSRDPSYDCIQFGPVLTENEIKMIEDTFSITLPAGYRAFLREIGNGGEGPGCGLYSVEGSIEEHNEKWESLARPFPHTEPWLPSSSDLTGTGDVAGIFEQDVYWFGPQNLQGTFPIAHYGCSLNARLVITGAECGNVWMEDFGADQGMWPITFRSNFEVCDVDKNNPAAPHLSFPDWYEAYLDERIQLENDLLRQLGRSDVPTVS